MYEICLSNSAEGSTEKYLDRFFGILEQAFLRKFMNVDWDNSIR